MAPIRVLHVLTAMDYAGTETLLMNIYRNIDRDVIQFDFAVSATKECAYDSEILSLGGRIYHYPRYKGTNHISYVKWWKKFFREHDEYRIVHGHIGSTAAIYLKIAKKAGCFAIAHSHNTKSTRSLKSLIYELYSRPTRRVADFFFGCSKQAIIDRYGMRIANDSSKAQVLNNAIDAKKFSFSNEVREKIRQQYGIMDDKIVIGTVGRLNVQKNPYEIVRICSELCKRGVDYEFWWFGKGELEEQIRNSINENGLENRVKLLGTRLDIYNALQGMDIFLFPSLWEGLGISCVEAQASGLPTICSDTIPIEAKFCSECEFIRLNDTSLWCDRIEEVISIVKSNDYKRPNNYEMVKNAQYDICAVACELVSMYLEWVKGY